jgi:uncharacterized membrane protein
MIRFESSVDLEVPVQTAYDRWNNLADLPMITERIPDERIAWEGANGSLEDAGAVEFARLGDERCRVSMRIDCERGRRPLGSVVGTSLRRMGERLERFKHQIEARGRDHGRRRALVDQLRDESGKAGWLFLWLLGVPIPLLLVLFLLRGCT